MTYNKEWLVEMNQFADKAQENHEILKEMTSAQLSYLVYWNWGYSGPDDVDVTKAAINELISRGINNYNVIGQEIDDYLEENNYY